MRRSVAYPSAQRNLLPGSNEFIDFVVASCTVDTNIFLFLVFLDFYISGSYSALQGVQYRQKISRSREEWREAEGSMIEFCQNFFFLNKPNAIEFERAIATLLGLAFRA